MKNSEYMGKRIAVFGFAFKKDTNDTRESAAIYVCKDLLEEGARLAIYDPKVDPLQIYQDLGLELNSDQITICADQYEAARGAHAITLLTEWDVFRTENTDYAQICAEMEKPAFFFDGRNLTNLDEMRAIGFESHGIGKP